VMNITDVEDKAIIAARKEGVSLERLQEDKARVFFSDWDSLMMERPDVVARASEHVPQMIALIRRICRRGYCKSDKDGVYFDVRKFRDYGRLGRLKNPRYFGKAHADDYAKEGLWDFRLWKKWTRGDGKTRWKSPFGEGRPGWHIECSAMSMHYLGESFDIHCGGSDNIFPHHENEIAQSFAATGKPLANFWLHSRHLTINKRKMSKRTGNVLYVKQLERMGVTPDCLRFYFLSERYRSPLDFTMQKFREKIRRCNEARKSVGVIGKLARKKGNWAAKGRGPGRAIARKLLRGFEGAMDDDLDTGLALGRIFGIIREAGKLADAGKLSPADAKYIMGALEKIDRVLCALSRGDA